APDDGADGLKRLFSSAVSTKANAPNKSGRLLEPPSVRFHTVCLGGFLFNQLNTQAQLTFAFNSPFR
ncbi:hypothetical protein, partial [Pseudomonas sp. PS01270]|uniref:hypothetical protein n=1 Tax=Pseudomonas sp. PS01270 TaxID=2991431 RepID=UPI00249A0F3B